MLATNGKLLVTKITPALSMPTLETSLPSVKYLYVAPSMFSPPLAMLAVCSVAFAPCNVPRLVMVTVASKAARKLCNAVSVTVTAAAAGVLLCASSAKTTTVTAFVLTALNLSAPSAPMFAPRLLTPPPPTESENW